MSQRTFSGICVAVMDSREKLGEAIREEKALKVCARHPRTVYYDEEECPACKASSEFLELTKEME
jgi:hypothetical protein